MSTGRRVTESLPSAFTAFFGASPPRFTPGATRKRDGSMPAFASGEDADRGAPASFEEDAESRPPAAPRKSAGRTGRMHGEMPVMKPPRRPSKRNIGSPYLEVVENARYLFTATGRDPRAPSCDRRGPCSPRPPCAPSARRPRGRGQSSCAGRSGATRAPRKACQ